MNGICVDKTLLFKHEENIMKKLATILIGLSINILMIASMILMHTGYPVFENVLNILNAYLVVGNLFVIMCVVASISTVRDKLTDQYPKILSLASGLTSTSMKIRQVLFYGAAFSVASWYGLWGTLAVLVFSALVTWITVLVMEVLIKTIGEQQ